MEKAVFCSAWLGCVMQWQKPQGFSGFKQHRFPMCVKCSSQIDTKLCLCDHQMLVCHLGVKGHRGWGCLGSHGPNEAFSGLSQGESGWGSQPDESDSNFFLEAISGLGAAAGGWGASPEVYLTLPYLDNC